MSVLNTFIKPRFIAIFFSVIAVFLRLHRLAIRDLLGDEIFQFNQMNRLIPFWKPIYNYGDHSGFPGEYILGWPMIQLFGDNKWGLALPHMAINAAGLFVFYLICKRYLKTSVGFIVAYLILTFNDSLVHYSLEFRPYAVLPTLALISFYFFDVLFHQKKVLNKRQTYIFTSFFLFTAIYHAYSIAIIYLPLCYQILASREKLTVFIKNKPLLLYIGKIIIISTLLWGWYASVNNFGLTPAHEGKYATITIPQGKHNPFEYIPNPKHDLVGFFRNVVGNLLGFKLFYSFLIGLPLIFFIRTKTLLKQGTFFLILVMLPISLILWVDVINDMWFLQRQFVWVMPYFAFFLGWIWDSITQAYQNSRFTNNYA